MATEAMIMRTEFGFGRTACDCKDCQVNCQFMPGHLIPADLDRMIPPFVDPLAWAETNLVASPGALCMNQETGEKFRVPTLVPATKPDGSCIHLTPERHCGIWEKAPFGCAFFDCGPEPRGLAAKGLFAIMRAWRTDSLYRRVWLHLHSKGLVRPEPEVLRQRMRSFMGIE